jgi:hypothetical protein
MIRNFRKKPVVIQAVVWNGSNLQEIDDFLGNTTHGFTSNDETMYIQTLEGKMIASKGDYIIKGVSNEFYPCKPDIFEKTYEQV